VVKFIQLHYTAAAVVPQPICHVYAIQYRLAIQLFKGKTSRPFSTKSLAVAERPRDASCSH